MSFFTYLLFLMGIAIGIIIGIVGFITVGGRSLRRWLVF